MTDYVYGGILVADAVTFRRATNAACTVYDVNDVAGTTPLALKDPSGVPLPNPITSSGDAFLPPLVTTSEGIKIVGGGLTVVVYSHAGMQAAAAASEASAQAAADSAATAAGNTMASAAVDSAGNLVIQKASGATVNAGPVKGAKGDKGDKGDKGADGANVLPTDDAIEQAITTAGTKTATALSATIDTQVSAAATDPNGVIKATYADAQDLSHPTRLDFIRRGKGGTIGTGGRPVIAFRFDHYVDATLANIWPLFVARGLPAGMGLISRPNNPVDPTTASWATIKNMVAQGNEVWSHSATHSDPGNTWEGMVDEIQNSRIELEAQGLTVMGWQMAGTATTNPNYGSNFTKASQFATPAGKLLMANYGLIEAYAGGARRVLPTYGCYGLDHVTVESLTLTILKGDVDRAISLGLGVEFMIHANRIGAAGYLSLADFTALLDYVVTKRDAGQIEVLTPSGLAFADLTHARRMDLIYGGDFETQTTAAPSPWSLPAGATIETSGGAAGSRFLRINATGASVGQGNSLVKTLNMNGFAFEIRGMIRYPSDLTAGRITAVDNTNAGAPITITQRDITPKAANTWEPFRVPFVMPKDTATFKLELRRLSTSGTTVDYDDVHVYAV